jgi:multimeric flavodoxin WrbA|tara:strand:- start:539 stop:1003 length:465 start_codon:yes stop_codon:yes gene_type:complete
MTQKKLLIIFHSKSGKNRTLADAVYKGASHPNVDVDIRFLKASDADHQDLLWADGILLGTPENFGYMSGALKDFFDRTFYEVEGKVDAKPYAIFIGTGNDGQGALSSIRRICIGYKFKEVQEPILILGELTESGVTQCEALGMGMAAGLQAGIF